MQMDLRDGGDIAGAADAEKRADQVNDQIDALLHKELQEWRAQAEALIPSLNQASQAAQSAVDQVETDVKNAQKVSDAMKALDQVITAAVKFLA
jgi:ABC-type transporter Mla subunit MlaD